MNSKHGCSNQSWKSRHKERTNPLFPRAGITRIRICRIFVRHRKIFPRAKIIRQPTEYELV